MDVAGENAHPRHDVDVAHHEPCAVGQRQLDQVEGLIGLVGCRQAGRQIQGGDIGESTVRYKSLRDRDRSRGGVSVREMEISFFWRPTPSVSDLPHPAHAVALTKVAVARRRLSQAQQGCQEQQRHPGPPPAPGHLASYAGSQLFAQSGACGWLCLWVCVPHSSTVAQWCVCCSVKMIGQCGSVRCVVKETQRGESVGCPGGDVCRPGR